MPLVSLWILHGSWWCNCKQITHNRGISNPPNCWLGFQPEVHLKLKEIFPLASSILEPGLNSSLPASVLHVCFFSSRDCRIHPPSRQNHLSCMHKRAKRPSCSREKDTCAYNIIVTMVYSFAPQKLETKWAESENGEASILHRYHHVFISASAEEKFGQDGEKMRPQQLPAYNPTVWAGEGNRPRKNNLVGNSPNLISHTVALIIINITWHFPFQKAFFWLLFKSVKLHFPQRDLLGPKSSIFFREKDKRKIILLWPCHWDCISPPACPESPSDILVCIQPKEREKQCRTAVQSVCAHHPS